MPVETPEPSSAMLPQYASMKAMMKPHIWGEYWLCDDMAKIQMFLDNPEGFFAAARQEISARQDGLQYAHLEQLARLETTLADLEQKPLSIR